jgi:hypothetical protein
VLGARAARLSTLGLIRPGAAGVFDEEGGGEGGAARFSLRGEVGSSAGMLGMEGWLTRFFGVDGWGCR